MNENKSIDSLELTTAFRKEEPLIFKNAGALTKDYEILAKIYQNLTLFKAYNSSVITFKRFANLSKALRNLGNESILMHFTDIDLYGVFTPDEYVKFCSQVKTKFDDLADDEGRYDDKGKLPVINVHLIEVVFNRYYIATTSDLVNQLSLQFIQNKFTHFPQYLSQEEPGHINNEDERYFTGLIQYLSMFDSFPQKIHDLQKQNAKLIELLKVSKTPCVYFIAEEPFDKRVKIGKSNDCNKRLKELQTGSASKLQILATIETPNPLQLEALLHQKYKNRRIHGEWFEMTCTDVDNCVNEYKFM